MRPANIFREGNIRYAAISRMNHAGLLQKEALSLQASKWRVAAVIKHNIINVRSCA